MRNVILVSVDAADWTLLDLRQFVRYDIAELICLCSPLHKPVPVYTKRVEPVEASVNTNKIGPLSERRSLFLCLVATEGFKANRAATFKRVIVLAQAIPQAFIHLVE